MHHLRFLPKGDLDTLRCEPGRILAAVVSQGIEMRDGYIGGRQSCERRCVQRLGDLGACRRLQDLAIIGNIRRGQARRRSHFDIGAGGQVSAKRRVDQDLTDDAGQAFVACA